MKVCVIGLGYIGLPTATVLADSGHLVVGVDTNKETVDTVNRGMIHIAEPHLRKRWPAVREGRLRASGAGGRCLYNCGAHTACG